MSARKMVIINDILYLSWKDLASVTSEKYLSKATTLFRQGLQSSYANIEVNEDLRIKYNIESDVRNLIAYNSIPKDTASKLPTENQLRASLLNEILEHAITDFAGLRYDQALNFFKANPHTYQHAYELAQQSIWLLFLASATPKQARNIGVDSVEALYKKALTIMLEKKWKRFKCNSLQVLRRKARPFKTSDLFEEALKSLVHKGIGNANCEKLGEEQQALIFQMYSDGAVKPTAEKVYMLYLQKAAEMIKAGKWTDAACVSLSTVKNFLYRDDVRQAYWRPRFGKQQARGKYEIITKRQAASFSNALWIIDGTPAHQYYLDGAYAYARINVFVVMDSYSWCIIGFYVTETESHEQVIGALRSACMLSGTLPHQIQSDNGSAISGYYGRTCIKSLANYYTPAAPGNARSKKVESFFKHFNQSVARYYPGFTHSPVMATNINNKPNPEAMQALMREKKIPSKDKAIELLHEMFSVWNHKPFNGTLSPLEKYKQSIKETGDRQRIFTKQHDIESFYHMPGNLKKIKGFDADGKATTLTQFVPEVYEYTNDGIKIKLDKQIHYFITDNPEFNDKYIGKKFSVKFDKGKATELYLYENTNEGLRPMLFDGAHAFLPNPEEFHEAIVDQLPDEAARRSKHLNKKKTQEQNALKMANKLIAITKANGTYTPLTPQNAFDKNVLTAAKQHLSEKIINGEAFRLTDEITEYNDERIDRFDIDKELIPVVKPISEEQSHSVSVDRWSLE